MEILKTLPPELYALAIVILLWISRELYAAKKSRDEKDSSLLQQNTIAIVQLTTEMKNFKEWFLNINTRVENNERDIDAFHQFKREHMKNGN